MGVGKRLSLVVASQCEAMGEGLRIARLFEAARGLDAVLRDPLRGACEAGLGDGRSLLIDQNHVVTYSAVSEAAGRAAEFSGLLILAWIGHGMVLNGDFYVLPQGSTPLPGHPEGPYHMTQHLKELIAEAPDLNLIVLIDACSSGDGAVQAAHGWTRLNGDARRRFQVLSASNTEEPAWDCAFTRAAAAVLRHGDIAAEDRLRAPDLKRAAEHASRAQQPVLVTWDGASGRDLWVSHNAALLREAGSLPAFSRADLPALRAGLRHYLPPPALTEVVRASREHAYVLVRGPAGYGKTTLLGALCRHEVSAGAVPEEFVHGLRLLKLHESASLVARDLAAQLNVTVDGFANAQASFEASISRVQWESMPEMERALLGPLRHLPPHMVVRIALDGFDQLSDTAAADIADLIDQLRDLPQKAADVRLVVSSRPGAAPPDADTEVAVDAATDTVMRAYLHIQQIPNSLLGAMVEGSSGSWLVASLLADHARATPDLDAADVPRGLAAVYEQAFDRGLEGGARWEHDDCPERALFTVLAVAGSGAVLPVPLLLNACARLGSPQVTETWLRTALPTPLRRFVVREPSGWGETATTLYGVFHQSLADYLTQGSLTAESPYTVDASDGHRSIAAAVAKLAPADQRTPATARHPLQDYAERAEPDHLWHSGLYSQALASLAEREAVVPAENLQRWQRWHDEALRTLGYDHPETLTTRGHIASWTGQTGHAVRALELFTELLPDRIRVLGHDHPSTLQTRHNIAHWTGETGDAVRALELFTELLPDRIRVLGHDHPSTLRSRNNIAAWTGETGDAVRALELFTELLPDLMRVLGHDHPDTLRSRNNIAGWTGETGDAVRALELFTELLPDRIRVLGPDDPESLRTRSNIAAWTGQTGDAVRALELLTELLPDLMRVLGPDHPETFRIRNNIAHWTGETGDAVRALELFTELLPDRIRVLGYDHPSTLNTRNHVAHWTGKTGRRSEALVLWRELLPTWVQVFGEGHLRTQRIRARISDLAGEATEPPEPV